MASIDIQEGYQRVHKAFEQINFNSYDFDSIKRSLVEYLQLNFPESFNDYIESSEIITIIEAFAYVGELLAYRTDMNAHENFISQATRKDSILRLARLIGYVSSRRESSHGLVRVDSVSTSESVQDSRGTELKNRVIKWNDSSNPHWQEQFFAIMGLILSEEYGNPIKHELVDTINYDLYGTRIAQLINGVFSYTVATSQKNIRMELVPSALDTNGPYEEIPDEFGEFRILYRDDSLGFGSIGTGFMMYTVQGELIKSVYDFQQPIPNRKVILPHTDINNDDIHVIALDTLANGIQTDVWNKVESMRGENLYFTPSTDRKNYEVVSLDQDGVEIHFGDSAFATIPIGPFNIWSRTSETDPIVIPRNKFQQKEFSFTYYDTDGNAQTATFRFSLIASLNNAASSEDMERIRSIAPSVYYTQDRMVNSRDYNEFLFQDPSVLKLKAVNRTFSGASKYQKFNDASGSYQNIKLFGDDLRVYIDDSYDSQIYTRDEGATEIQLIDTILEDVLAKKEVQDHLRNIQGVVSPRTKFREEVLTQFTYTGSSITASLDRPYPERGHDQEKTELQGRIDGKYYGATGTSLATYPADGLVHTDYNINVYILDFDIPGESKYYGVTMDELVPGIFVEGIDTGAKGVIQSVYPVDTPSALAATYAGYDVTLDFPDNDITTDIGSLYINGNLVTTGITVLSASTLSASATTNSSIATAELQLADVAGAWQLSTDTWYFAGQNVNDGSIYVDNTLLTASNYTVVASTTIDTPSASALQAVELRYTPVSGTDNGSSGDATWNEVWQFVGTPKSVIEGTVYINGSPATAGVDYVVPTGSTDLIWTTYVAPTPIELRFDNVVGAHTNHIADWKFDPTLLGVSAIAANIEVDGSVISSAFYTIVNASNIQVDASAQQTLTLTYTPNQGVYVTGIDRWEFNNGSDFTVSTDFTTLWLNGDFVKSSLQPYTLTQTSASTANVQIEANTLNTTSLELQWNEAGIMVIEASSTQAVLSFNDYEQLTFSTETGNINTNGGIGGEILSQANNLYTYQIQDGSGGGVGSKSLGLHTGGINTGATSNDAFGIGYDRTLDQYYTIAPEDLGAENAKFSREYARDVSGYNRDDSWLIRVTPIRSGGQTQYMVGNRSIELAVYGITKEFYYQNNRFIKNQDSGLIVEDTFTVLGTNPDIYDERSIGENLLFPVVRQPLNTITGKQDRNIIIIKEQDTNQDGIPDEAKTFERVVDVFSPNIILGLDGRHNDLSNGELQVARDIASVYGPSPHIFDFSQTPISWQERTDYYGDGAWEISGPFNLTYLATDGTDPATSSNPVNSGSSSLIGGGIKYVLPDGNTLTDGYDLLFDGKEVPEQLYAIEASAVHVAFSSFMGYSTPTGTESLELKPRGIETTLDDNLQLASTLNVPELTDFTVETIIRMDNMEAISIYDGFHLGGFTDSQSNIVTTDMGWKLEIKSSVSGSAANMVELTIGDGYGYTDASTMTAASQSISFTLPTDPVTLRTLPFSWDFNDKLFHHIAVVRSTAIEYKATDLNNYTDSIKPGDKITDANGSTALVWDKAVFDETSPNGHGLLWIYDVNLAIGTTAFGSIDETLTVNELLLDGTYGNVITSGLTMNGPSYRTLKFFVDGYGSPVINLDNDYPLAIDFNPVLTDFFPNVNLLSNRKTITPSNIPTGESSVAYCDGISISRGARYGENFNDINNVYKKYPRIFPQTVFFHRPDDLSDYAPVLTVPSPTTINDDISSTTPDKRLYKEIIGRDDIHYLWTHFTQRSNLIDPSKTNIIDIFLHSRGYQRELDDWLARNDIYEPMPVPPSSFDLKIAYGQYLVKGMLSDTIIMHPGRIKYLFGSKAPVELRAKFSAIKKTSSTVSDEQLKSLILDIINSYFDINDWDFGRSFYFTDLAAEIHKQLPKDVQSIVLVPLIGSSRFGDLFQVEPEDDEILQSAATTSDIEIIAGITRQNIRRSDE